jgi:hypothetical protein
MPANASPQALGDALALTRVAEAEALRRVALLISAGSLEDARNVLRQVESLHCRAVSLQLQLGRSRA